MEDKAKVLFVTFTQIPSASGRACWFAEEIRELTRHFDLDVLSLKSDDLSHIERFHGARLLRVPVGSGEFITKVKTFQRALNRQLDSEDYLLCHFTSIWEGMVLASRRKATGFKMIYEVQSLPSVDFKAVHPDEADVVEQSYSLKQQEERCLAMADRVLAGSRLLQEHLVGRGIPRERIHLVRPAIDLAPFDNAGELSRASVTILYLGSLAPWQGISSLLMAISELPHALPVKLLLVTPKNDPGLTKAQGKIQMLGLARRVEWAGPASMEELPALVARANVCVAPLANHEHNRRAASTPHKILVYMAGRRPVVAASQPVVREIMEDGAHGLLYHPGDTAGLAEALHKLLLNRDLATRLGNQARLHLEDHLHLPGSLRRLLDAYHGLVGLPSEEARAALEPDTSPRLQAQERTERSSPDSDTRPVPREVYERDGSDLTPTGQLSHTEDTAPIPVPPLPIDDKATVVIDTNASGEPAEETEGELTFQSVFDEDTAPRATPGESETWQVLDLAEVDLPDAPPPVDKQASRWLLGGPPFPVQRDAPDTQRKIRTEREASSDDESAGRPDTSPGIEFVSDSDVVEVVGTDDIEPIDDKTVKTQSKPPRSKPKSKSKK